MTQSYRVCYQTASCIRWHWLSVFLHSGREGAALHFKAFIHNSELWRRFGSLLFALASLLALLLLNLSFGWFSRTDGASATGMTVSAADGSDCRITGYTVYRYDDSGKLHADKSLTLREYDTIFTEKNTNTAAVVRLEVEGLAAGDPFRVTLTCSDAGTAEDHLSDIIIWRLTSLSLSAADDAALYSAACDAFRDVTPDYAFRTVNGADAQKVTSVTSESVTMAEGGAVYLLVDYSPALIDRTGIQFSGESDATKGYPGDLTAIELTADKGGAA